MARTSMFWKFRHWLELSRLAHSKGWSAEEVLDARDAFRARSRREFLHATAGLFAAGGLLPSLTGCESDSTSGTTNDADATTPDASDTQGGADTSSTPPLRVAIIGAGLAGLHCAFRLEQAGVTARIFDAWNRAGGRVFSARGEYPEGMVAELGGELIDTGHVVMHHLADEFGIDLDDLFADEAPGLERDSWFFDGRFLTEVEVVDAFLTVAQKMQATLLAVEPVDGPYNDEEFARIDAMSLAAYLDDELSAPETIKAILHVAYTGEYGLSLEQQSPWNLLWLIDAETPEPFRIFGDSDERFHARGGNDQFTTKLAEGLGSPVETKNKLTAIERSNDDATLTLTFDRDGTPVTEGPFDRVVFALPFNQLRKVSGLDAVLSAEKLEIVNGLGYGTNSKLMMGFQKRVWQVDYAKSGSMFSDTGGQTFWDTSRKQPGTAGIYTNFTGGKRGVDVGTGEPEAQALAVVDELEAVFPGIKAAYIPGSGRRMHWPSVPTLEGSYTCYLPGQAAWSGLEGVAEGSLHFCGEHTSVEAQGYMEGAAESGARVAGEILDAVGIARPDGLSKVLALLET